MRRPTCHIIVLLLLWTDGCLANYRSFHVDNADICNKGRFGTDAKVLDIGTGAALFQLKTPSTSFQPNYRNKAKRCEIHIKAPDKDHGLMVYVEEMRMRKSSRDGACVDYVQFGQDDIVPFLTYSKSERYCGQVQGKHRIDRGISYDDEHGNLLIWVSLGGRRETSSWPSISVVNLTLVVTTYKKKCSKPDANFRRCRERSRCIWKHYFCDKHFNCVSDRFPEDEDGCTYDTESGLEHTTLSPDHIPEGGPIGDLNTLWWALSIAGAAVLFVFLLLCCCSGKKKSCCGSDPGGGNDPRGGDHLEQPRSLVELDRQRHLRETEANIYLPLNPDRRETTSLTTQQAVPPVIPEPMPPPEMPPPAYEDLFPDRVAENMDDRETAT